MSAKRHHIEPIRNGLGDHAACVYCLTQPSMSEKSVVFFHATGLKACQFESRISNRDMLILFLYSKIRKEQT